MMERFCSQSRGNLSLLLLVDSSKKSSYAFLEKTTFSALEHFGMPYRVLDLTEGQDAGWRQGRTRYLQRLARGAPAGVAAKPHSSARVKSSMHPVMSVLFVQRPSSNGK